MGRRRSRREDKGPTDYIREMYVLGQVEGLDSDCVVVRRIELDNTLDGWELSYL